MTIAQIIEILGNRLRYLQSQRTLAVSFGDLAQVSSVDAEIAQTISTLTALQSLG
jgi:hypothetical protein